MTIDYTATTELLAARLTSELRTALGKGSVLWIVPGGSNVPVVVRVLELLQDARLDRLALLPSDERYGPVGHSDSNVHALKQAGLRLGSARLEPILTGKPFADTVADADARVATLVADADTVVSFLGMGADGHIAGILPDSPAADSQEWVVGYDAPRFRRITLTPRALGTAAITIVGAFGAAKLPALERLRSNELSVAEQPAQLLKTLPRGTIITDQPKEAV